MAEGHGTALALGWFVLGLTGGLLAVVLARRWTIRLLGAANTWIVAASLSGVAALAVALLLAQRSDAPAPTVAAATTPSSASAMGSSPDSGGSMEAATAALGTRLAAKGGSDADWELLAQSYDFLGRAEDAKLARQHKVNPQRSLGQALASSAWMVGASPRGAAATAGAGAASAKFASLVAQAEDHRRKREFKEACDVYRQLIAAGGMTADTWADYADALASATPGGSLSGAPAEAIAKALALDPKHTKALWLKASAAFEERRYQDALTTWRTLLALIPPGSSDARIIEANIAETARLAGAKPGNAG